MQAVQFGALIKTGDVAALMRTLDNHPSLARQPIPWQLNQSNLSDPLHYVCDCVFNNWLPADLAAPVAELLLQYGASINGTDGRESPLIGATSLGVEAVAGLLIEAGAELESSAVFGARAMHWAAAMGLSDTLQQLLDHGAELEARCSEFGSTPLYWAVVGAGPDGPNGKRQPLAAVQLLLQAGANPDTANRQGVSALQCAQSGGAEAIVDLLRHALG